MHFDFVTPFFKNLFVGEILYCLTITFAKFSILCFCWRIFGSTKSIRLPIYILSGIVSMWTLAVVSLSYDTQNSKATADLTYSDLHDYLPV